MNTHTHCLRWVQHKTRGKHGKYKEDEGKVGFDKNLYRKLKRGCWEMLACALMDFEPVRKLPNGRLSFFFFFGFPRMELPPH